MERDNTALTAAVNRAALASAAPRKRWLNNLLDLTGTLPRLGPIDPWRRPKPSDDGARLATEGIETQISVKLRADPTGRTIWLVIDTTAATVVTGNCTIRLNPGTLGPVSTFAASSTPIADVTTLWAAQIVEDYDDNFEVTVQATKNANDTIQIRRRSDADAATDSTFVIAQLTAPAALNLTLVREIEEVEALLWVRSAAIRSGGLNASAIDRAHRDAWSEYKDVAFPTIGPSGCLKADVRLSSCAAVWVQLTDAVLPVGESLTPAATGDGIRRIINYVSCAVAQQPPGGV